MTFEDLNVNDEGGNNSMIAPAIRLEPPTNENTEERLKQIDELKYFLGTATNDWDPLRQVHQFHLPTGESLSCVFWNDLFHVTGTDIVRTLLFRFHLFGRPVTNLKKFEEGIFSDLRNLKPGMDASLEEPKSEFLEMLYKNNCIRTQKKQKVFYWFSVPHDRLFLDALERDLKREKMGLEPTSVAIAEPATSLSLDTTQELFDQLRKSMSLNAAATAHAIDENLNSELNNSNSNDSESSLNACTNDSNNAIAAIADDHDPPESASSSICSHDLNFDTSPVCNDTGKTGHRSTRSLSFINVPPSTALNSPSTASFDIAPIKQTSYSAGTSPKLSFAECPISTPFDHETTEKQQKIFGAFSLFEGSPTYKQRQRKRTTSFNAASLIFPFGTDALVDGGTNQFDMAALNAGLAFSTQPKLFHSFLQQQANGGYYNELVNPEKVYTCPLTQCAKIFKRLEHLKRHFRTHTMERPYSCSMCGKHFSRTDNLAQHKRTHSRARSSSVILSRGNSTSSNKTSRGNKPPSNNAENSNYGKQKSTAASSSAGKVHESDSGSEIIKKLSIVTHANDGSSTSSPTALHSEYYSSRGDYFDEAHLAKPISPTETTHFFASMNLADYQQVYDPGMMGEALFDSHTDMIDGGDVMISEDVCMTKQDNMTTINMYEVKEPVQAPASTYGPFLPASLSSSYKSFYMWQNDSNRTQYDPEPSSISSTTSPTFMVPTVSASSSSSLLPYDQRQYYSYQQSPEDKEHQHLWHPSPYMNRPSATSSPTNSLMSLNENTMMMDAYCSNNNNPNMLESINTQRTYWQS